jgi:glucan phosphoethanolaminetransferase (alkaline phosphatase superfamily)
LTAEGISKSVNNVKIYLWGLAVSAWAAVLTGAYIVYPWYRATPPAGTTDLSTFPKFLLLANENTAQWHELGMEWKEHVAFLAPIAATVVAFAVSYYGPLLAKKVGERRALMIFFVFAFAAAAAAGMLGAFITKYAPVH